MKIKPNSLRGEVIKALLNSEGGLTTAELFSSSHIAVDPKQIYQLIWRFKNEKLIEPARGKKHLLTDKGRRLAESVDDPDSPGVDDADFDEVDPLADGLKAMGKPAKRQPEPGLPKAVSEAALEAAGLLKLGPDDHHYCRSEKPPRQPGQASPGERAQEEIDHFDSQGRCTLAPIDGEATLRFPPGATFQDLARSLAEKGMTLEAAPTNERGLVSEVFCEALDALLECVAATDDTSMKVLAGLVQRTAPRVGESHD